MKKSLILSLIACALIACEGNDSLNDGPTASKDVKYVIESGSQTIYQENQYDGWDALYKNVYEREEDLKLIKSISFYKDDVLTGKQIYQHDGNKQISWLEGVESNYDTIVWYDEERTKPLEQRFAYGSTYYQYDKKHRLINKKSYYLMTIWENDKPLQKTMLQAESNYTYSGLICNAETKAYDPSHFQQTGELIVLSTATESITYKDDSFTDCTSADYESVDTYGVKSVSHTTQEFVKEGVSKYEYTSQLFNPDGSEYNNSHGITEYTWQDELNVTYHAKRYTDDVLIQEYKGYTKYVK